MGQRKRTVPDGSARPSRESRPPTADNQCFLEVTLTTSDLHRTGQNRSSVPSMPIDIATLDPWEIYIEETA